MPAGSINRTDLSNLSDQAVGHEESQEALYARASEVLLEGQRLAESLRQEGLVKARALIKRAECEAQSVILGANEMANTAEQEASARAVAM